MASEEKGLGSEARPKQSPPPLSEIVSSEDGVVFISLSHYEMHKLIHQSQNFISKVVGLNKQAVRQIMLGSFKEALALLLEAQKILEYAAGSGKTIEKDLIICILHNIATGYHRLWLIEKCNRYVEGVIFNLENYLHSLQNSVASSNLNQEIQLALQGLSMKNMLSSYCLRFCALNSQQENHRQALNAAKKAVGYVRNVITFDEHHTRNLIRKESESQSEAELKHRLLLEIMQFQTLMNCRKQKEILKAAHFSYQIWNKQKEKGQDSRYKGLKSYSIGNFMEFQSKNYQQKSSKMNHKETRQKSFESSITYKVLVLSISFFSISTQIRLASSNKQYLSQLDKDGTFQHTESEIYHLLSIIVIAAFLPCEILYLRHLLSSYASTFNSGFMDYKTVQTESLQKIIQLISGSGCKFPNLGSTEIISSQEVLPQLEGNDYRLKDHFHEKFKKQPKKTSRNRKQNDKSQSKRNFSKNFSSLESKSIIKEDKKGSSTKDRVGSKIKTRSKNRSKGKTHEKKDVTKHFFVKTSTSKSKRKHAEEQLGTISKKVSPRKVKEHPFSKEIAGSEIVYKQRKRSVLAHKVGSIKRLLHETKSPKRRTNVYGLHY